MNILSIVPFCLLLMIPICTSAEEKVERTDAEWDEILSGITIESATPEPDPALEGKKSKTHIRSNYSGLEKGRPPKQGSSYQEKNFKNATNAASTEAIDVEMQLMTESIDDLIPIEGEPTPIELPSKPSGFTIVTLSSGNVRQGIVHDKLLIRLDVNDEAHSKYLMAFLAQKSQEGWTWEQKQKSQNISRNDHAVTELEIFLEKPAD